MRKGQSSTWIGALLSLGVLGLAACTVQTTEKSDAQGGSGGSSERGGTNSGGGSGAMPASNGGSSAANGGASAGDGGASETEGGQSPGSGGVEAGGSGGGAGTDEGGAGGSGGQTEMPSVDLLNCKTRTKTGATVVEGALQADTTWSGTVYVSGSVEIKDGATLTIEPGTDVVMGPDALLDVGWNGGAATLKAAGTEAKPIRFCGEQGDAGFWRGIVIQRNVTSNSQFHNVLISDAGAADQALDLAADVEVQNVQVRNAQHDGVRAEDFKAGSAALSVEGVGGTALVLTHANAVDHFPLGGSFENNGKNIAAIDFTDIGTNVTFHELGVPYQQMGALSIRDVSVVFEPGVHYLFGPDATLDVGWNGNAGTLTAVGTSAAPIVFDGVNAESGYWSGIKIQRNVTTNSQLSNVEIRHAGGNGAYALDLGAPITLADVLLSDSDQGAYIGEKGLGKNSKNVTITKGAQRPLTIEPNAIISLPPGSTFTGNAVDEVAVEGGDYDQSGTALNPGVPFRLLSGVKTLKSSLTLSAGTEIIMPADGELEIGWNGNEATFIAAGTAAKPIRFVGGDPTAGYWGGILIGTHVLSASKLDYAEVSHGKAACLTLRSSIPVTHSTFSDCEGYGILKDSDDTRDYTTTNTFTNVGSGGVGTL